MGYKSFFSYSHLEEYEAYNWYEEQRLGLADEFLNELETAYYKIAETPQHYSFIDERKILRDYLLPRFPFLIVYRIKDTNIDIIAIHHAKKHPSKKYGINK